jgi:hypothetical protein
MPNGTVSLERGAHGHLKAQVDMFGLTPGSSHEVSIDDPSGHAVQFPDLNANAVGQADATLTSVSRVAWLARGSRFVVRLGDTSGNALAAEPLAAEPIAESGVLPKVPRPGSAFAFRAVTVDTKGVSFGQPAGRATITYDAAAHTLTVTVTASGLNPGSHAAHIHLGSCQSQGAVKYMLADFIANAQGDITNQTRVVTGVTSVPGPGYWYLNLHQGGMSQILANGVPTLYFRPMLCADITSFATAGGTPSPSPTASTPASGTGSPSASPSASPTPTNPAATPTMTMPASSPSPSSPSSSPSSIPTDQPTHW